MTCLKRHAFKIESMESKKKKKKTYQGKIEFQNPMGKKDPKTFQENKKACHIQRIKNRNNIKLLTNDTEAGDQNSGKKLFFNFEFYIKTIKYVSVHKNIFMHPESQRNLLPVQFSQEVTGGCVLPNKELNQDRGRHRIPKKQDPVQKRGRGFLLQEQQCVGLGRIPKWVKSRGWKAPGEKHS